MARTLVGGTGLRYLCTWFDPSNKTSSGATIFHLSTPMYSIPIPSPVLSPDERTIPPVALPCDQVSIDFERKSYIPVKQRDDDNAAEDADGVSRTRKDSDQSQRRPVPGD